MNNFYSNKSYIIMQEIQIKLIEDNSKFEKVELVEPNIKHNRCDIRYGKDFELIEVRYEDKIKYISFYCTGRTAFLGLYMVEIPQYVFNRIIEFLKNKQKISHIHFINSLNYIKGAKKKMHWLLELPDNWEDYLKQFSSKHRYNIRYYKKKLEQTYNCEWKYYPQHEINKKMIDAFFDLKKDQKKEKAYSDLNNAEIYLKSDFNKITDAYVLYINNEIKSIILYSIIDGQTAYCHNMAYDTKFSKYNIGNELYYYSIKDLIKRGIRKIYLGGGNYKYKKNSNAIKSVTYNGNIFLLNFWQKIFSCFYEPKPQKRITFVILGIKISFKL